MRAYTGGCHCGRIRFEVTTDLARAVECNCYVPRSHPDHVDVNVRCLDGVDLHTLAVEPFDGRHWGGRASMTSTSDAARPGRDR